MEKQEEIIMMKTKVSTTAGIICVAVVMLLSLTFLFSRPVAVADSVLGITSTPTALPPDTPIPPDTPTPTDPPVPTATTIPSPTSSPTASPRPKATSVSPSPTPTPAPILPLSGGETGRLYVRPALGGAVLLLGWLLYRLRRTRRANTRV